MVVVLDVYLNTKFWYRMLSAPSNGLGPSSSLTADTTPYGSRSPQALNSIRGSWSQRLIGLAK